MTPTKLNNATPQNNPPSKPKKKVNGALNLLIINL